MLKSGLVIALLAVGQTAPAQQPSPGAGGQLQQIPPAPLPEKAAPDMRVENMQSAPAPAAEGATLRVDKLLVTGNTLFGEAELVAAAAVVPGNDLSLAQLRDAAARIAAFYNERGYFLAQAYLPAQDIKDGAVTVAVVEGRYGTTGFSNRAGLSDGAVSRALAGLKTGDPVTAAPLERRLLLLSDIPGIKVRSTLAPGTDVGTSNLMINITQGGRITGSVEADNGGNRYTGAYRLGGSVNLNNPTGIGDVLSLRLLGSTGKLGYGRAAYQATVGSATVGVAVTHLRYELGREFRSLEADGTANIASVFGSYPMLRSRDANLYALAGIDAKWLTDRIDLVSTRSRRTSRALNLGFSGDTRDGLGGGGRNLFSAGLAVGDLHLQSPLDRAADALTARSEGGFSRLQLSAARLQAVSGPLSLYAAVRGQFAFGNLDSSEKMELGGAYGVRAYPEGEAYGDEGWLGTLEARLALSRWTGELPGELQLFGFVDLGEVKFADEPWSAGSNRGHRSGAGAGLGWAAPGGVVAKVSYARKLGDAVATSGPDRDGRFWFQISKLF
ncbi:MAG TPA: ShlB/FhaC/HecB family hemolysin secretion/activation protein [Allosphingosinicella sp.]|jgi:hemolysin activation/secretion protein